MSQIQGTSSASYAIQWQYLQSAQQSNADPMLQSNASDPMSFGADSLSGGSQTQPSGGSSGPPFSLGAMNALINAQEQSAGSNMSGLSQYQQKVFNELDPNGTGSITKAGLENAFGANNKDLADAVFAKLDTNGDGSISQSEFAAGTTRGPGGHHHHMHAPPPDNGSQDGQSGQVGQGAQDPLAQLLSASGANSTSTSNSDGSTTTTISYADGSKVSMTSAASSTNSDNSANANTSGSTQQNLLEQLIKMQSQLIQSMSASASSSTSLATI
jgi:hypothetical protein